MLCRLTLILKQHYIFDQKINNFVIQENGILVVSAVDVCVFDRLDRQSLGHP